MAALHFHEKITSDNSKFGGVHPIISLDSHQENLSKLVAKSLQSLPDSRPDGLAPYSAIVLRSASGQLGNKRKPDFISVTRGPGMRSSLSTGLDTAKGLATAWQIPLLGIHHMQAHALTPRLVSALSPTSTPTTPLSPAFPFLSLLVSGGHTLLLHSTSATSHITLAETSDIALGDCLDKIARHILPSSILSSAGAMYGPLLEAFAFPGGPSSHNYNPPVRRAEELARKPTHWGWTLAPPLSETRSGTKTKSMEYSFSGLDSACRRIAASRQDDLQAFPIEERRDLAKEAMRVAFEHIASRVVMALRNLAAAESAPAHHENGAAATPSEADETAAISMRGTADATVAIRTLVLSGGVAANAFLKAV
ncbi:hypothetical protein MMC30_000070 [Trapelia coarctata]|nr:hypothetical protein [Trapelia coarctata]